MSRATRSHLPARPWTVIGIVLLLVMPRGPSAASLSRYVVALEAEASTGAHTEPPLRAPLSVCEGVVSIAQNGAICAAGRRDLDSAGSWHTGKQDQA